MIRYLLGSVLLFTCIATSTAQQIGPIKVSPENTGGYRINGSLFMLDPGQYGIGGIQYILLPANQAPAQEKPKEEPKAPREDTPPPAPKDPDEGLRGPAAPTAPAVKSDSGVAKKAPSREEVIKSIQNNTQLQDNVKKEILENLLNGEVTPKPPLVESKTDYTNESVKQPDFSIITLQKVTTAKPETIIKPTIKTPSTTKKDGFDLLQAFQNKSSTPEVKAYSDETPLKPANPPREEPKKTDPKKDFLLLPMGETTDTIDPVTGVEIPATEIGITVGSKVDYAKPWDQTKSIPFGKVVQFWVKPVGKRPDKLKSVAYTWTVLPKEDVILWPDTTRIIISSGNKQQNYVVMLTASYVYVDGEKIIQRASQSITMVQVGDGTTPTPGGNAGPTAPPPDLGTISKAAFEWTNLVLRGDGYDDAQVKNDAKKLAAVFAGIATKIDNAQLTDINDILSLTKTENDKALGESRNEWLPWFNKVSEMLKAGFKDGNIRTPQHYAQVWKDISKGLAAVSK